MVDVIDILRDQCKTSSTRLNSSKNLTNPIFKNHMAGVAVEESKERLQQIERLTDNVLSCSRRLQDSMRL